MRKNIPYGRQEITEEDIQSVVQTLKSDFLTQGPAIAEFENLFAQYIGVKYAVAVSNGTAALHLCTLALEVNEHTRVITTPITFAASANCVRYCGGTVDFCDIDPTTLLMDLDALERKLAAAPVGTYHGVIPVDFAGYPVQLERLKALALQYQLWIIEDACHAPGGYFKDAQGVHQNCGNGQYADLAIFSFHPVKHIATGEGGMITTNDEKLYQKLLLLRTHGITKDPLLLQENHGPWYYEMQTLGYNYRLSDMQAALGISQLKRADQGVQRRRAIAKKYDQAFKSISAIQTIDIPEGIGHAYHLYVIQVPNRADLYQHLRAHSIFAQVHYIPVHTMPYYQSLGWKVGDLPKAEAYYQNALSIPMFPSMTDEEQQYVINTIVEFYSSK